ncbi:MAG: hypothetical protein IT350_13500 [Deltaproteobacteria bacterium]|nr:hypothetical protein [Deltaproteobacteria bacterium]
MIALGLCDGHDAGAALAFDGRIVAAVSEERFTRVKRQPGFPVRAIESVLALAGVRVHEVDRVGVAEVAGRAAFRLVAPIYRVTDPNRPADRLANRAVAWAQNFVARQPTLARTDAAISRRALASRLRDLGIVAPLELVDHHRAHALAAACGSPFDDALVVTMDAFGDGASATVSTWRGGALTELDRTPYPRSAALLFGRITAHLGFAEGEEGKVCGLAARGDRDRDPHRLRALIRAAQGRVLTGAPPSPARLDAIFRHWPPEDVAAATQRAVEDAVSEAIGFRMTQAGARRLVLAGGLFANVRLNQIVAARCGADDLDVFPHMGDGGLCVGAAWAVSPPGAVARMPVFLGPEPEVVPASERGDTRVSAIDPDSICRLAAIVERGGVIGLVHGRMEFGPRALGHRSLVFSAARRDVAARLDRALGRPAIMPFAPAIRTRDFARLARGPMHAAFARMAVTADAATLEVARRWPVAVHADGSMRAQTVDPAENPLLHALLDAFAEVAEHGEPPVVINTSFNRHAEPIVMTARDALARAREWGLAALVLGENVWEFAA